MRNKNLKPIKLNMDYHNHTDNFYFTNINIFNEDENN